MDFPQGSLHPPRASDSALREVVARNGSGMSQDMARYFGEHMAMLHAATSSRPSQTMENASEGDETEPLSGERWADASRDLAIPSRHVSVSTLFCVTPTTLPSSLSSLPPVPGADPTAHEKTRAEYTIDRASRSAS